MGGYISQINFISNIQMHKQVKAHIIHTMPSIWRCKHFRSYFYFASSFEKSFLFLVDLIERGHVYIQNIFEINFYPLKVNNLLQRGRFKACFYFHIYSFCLENSIHSSKYSDLLVKRSNFRPKWLFVYATVFVCVCVEIDVGEYVEGDGKNHILMRICRVRQFIRS